ncbi:MAG: cytochrome c biogenesis protein DipZ [Actinomycetaceae bacterium]|nr:cytochrome c biogenesis protein DipZ [Actinomycetaceae bacterium]
MVILSLIAGILTVLAPCVLPLLPIVVGGSLEGDKKRPYIIAGSLVVSLMLFTLLLKATSTLIHVDPRVWSIGAGILIVFLGVAMLMPNVWARLTSGSIFEKKSQEMLRSAQSQGNSTLSAVLTGAALGPVFNSCSPTYAWVVATVIPSQPAVGLLYLTVYCIGLAGALLGISLFGRSLISKLGWAANPYGRFQKLLAVLFIIVGLLVTSGLDRKVEAWLVSWVPSFTQIEQELLPSGNASLPSGETLKSRAPEFTDIDGWINSSPLTMEQLRGKVVLVDFWTYSCINCQRTQSHLNAWYDAYQSEGFEVVGIHAPEFSFERKTENVKRAVERAEISYPVALDNEFSTWNAFRNQYWPAKYLIDREGYIRYTHFGEGEYEETESMIRTLLDTSVPKSRQPVSVDQPSRRQSPETYLGYRRADGFVGPESFASGESTFVGAPTLRDSEWTLSGTWRVDDEKVTAVSEGATLSYRFSAQHVYLVLSGNPGARVLVDVDGVAELGRDVDSNGYINLDSDRLYELVSLPEFSPNIDIHLTFDEGVSAYAFTFG